MELSVVLPCFNEAPNIERTIRDVEGWLRKEGIDGEIIAVDDGSADATAEAIERAMAQVPVVRMVRHEKNLGYGAAVRSGCDAATKRYVSFMDSDGQFRAEELGLLVPKLSAYRLVAGYRMHRADPLHRLFNAWLYGLLVRMVLGVKKKDMNCSLVVFERDLWRDIRPQRSTGALFCAEMYLALKQRRVPFAQVGVPHYPRAAGASTGANPFVILRMFRELLRLKRSAVQSSGGRLGQ